MSVPTFEKFMLPILHCLQELGASPAGAGESGSEGGRFGESVELADLRDCVRVRMNLSDEDVAHLLPSGKNTYFKHRHGWALHGLGKAKLVERKSFAKYQITTEGIALLAKHHEEIDRKTLRDYPSYVSWETRVREMARNSRVNSQNDDVEAESMEEEDASPVETLEQAAENHFQVVEADLLEKVMNAHQSLLESLVVELLISMGYGRGNPDHGRLTGKTGDRGFDGVVYEDPLGLEEVVIQAKHHGEGNPVGSGAVRDFVGAMDLAGVGKGVLVTTSSFSKSAKEAVTENKNKHIALIDGTKLARLMRQHCIGARRVAEYYEVAVDDNYFEVDGER